MSKCLGFEPCRYDGGIVENAFIGALKCHIQSIPICPEMEFGLGVPREPLRVTRDNRKLSLIQPATKIDLTAQMHAFCSFYLASLPEPDGFILKSKSPSCGIRDVKQYAGADSTRPLGKGSGLFAGEVLARFPHPAVEDEARLARVKIRQHFLTKLFTLARYREVMRNGTLEALRAFHSRNELLLLAYNRAIFNRLCRIMDNCEKKTQSELFDDYWKILSSILAQAPRRDSFSRILRYSLSLLSEKLSAKEEALIGGEIGKYDSGLIPVVIPLAIMKSFIARYDEGYLAKESFFNPYPQELAELDFTELHNKKP
jgi:uncharacterized protein YbgA (DUF1722 family)/uncharacterized protein YbbK (DUF523 family)